MYINQLILFLLSAFWGPPTHPQRTSYMEAHLRGYQNAQRMYSPHISTPWQNFPRGTLISLSCLRQFSIQRYPDTLCTDVGHKFIHRDMGGLTPDCQTFSTGKRSPPLPPVPPWVRQTYLRALMTLQLRPRASETKISHFAHFDPVKEFALITFYFDLKYCKPTRPKSVSGWLQNGFKHFQTLVGHIFEIGRWV